MATVSSSTVTSSSLYRQSILRLFSQPYQLNRRNRSLLAKRRLLHRLAVSGGPPSPPGLDPPPPEDTTQLAGLVGAVTRTQDRIKIFLAVLFWMSLFFWVTVTDGRGKGKGKKGSRFK